MTYKKKNITQQSQLKLQVLQLEASARILPEHAIHIETSVYAV